MKKIGLLLFIFITANICIGQIDDNYVYGDNASKTKQSSKNSGGGGFDWSRTTIGGGFGMVFGDYTIIEVAPTFGYYLTDELILGIGAGYTYYSDKRNNFSTSLYAGRLFAEYLIPDFPIMAHAELEVINVEDFNDGSRINVINPYVGGGIKQNIGGNSYFYILVLWNLNETPESYSLQPFNPIIRGGVAIGL